MKIPVLLPVSNSILLNLGFNFSLYYVTADKN